MRNKSFEYQIEAEPRPLRSRIYFREGALLDLQDIDAFQSIRRASVHLLVTDDNVEKLHLQTALSSLERIGLKIRTLIVPASEASKSFEWYARLVREGLDLGFDKESYIFSLGGGVVNNVAGFLASTLYRGIGLIHFPTSLLAQVDAAIDFKQAINFEHGKNLIGSFFSADAIIIDPSLLQTLDIRLLRDGLAESLKHAFCQDSDFLTYIRQHSREITDPNFLATVVSRSIELKLEVMRGTFDAEYEESIKHYGHAVGHAIEFLSRGSLYHGESISIGMCVSAEIGRLLGVTDDATIEGHYEALCDVGLPIRTPDAFALFDIWDKVRYDKHFRDDQARLALIRTTGVVAKPTDGNPWFHIDRDLLLHAIDENRSRSSQYE